MKIERLNQLLLSLSAAGAVALTPLALNAQMGPEQPAEQPEVDEPITEDSAETEAVMDLVDQIRDRDDMSEIAAILEAVDLENIIDEGESYTFLLPNDDAFAELEGDGAGTFSAEADQTKLETLVRSHIARGNHSAEALRDGPVSSLGEYRIEGSRDLLLRTEVRRIDGNDETVGEKARLVDSDIEVTEGVLHVVNRAWTGTDPAQTGEAMEGYDEDATDEGDNEKDDKEEDENASDAEAE